MDRRAISRNSFFHLPIYSITYTSWIKPRTSCSLSNDSKTLDISILSFFLR